MKQDDKSPAPGVTLFFYPGACSRVTMTALEQAGVEYTATLIDIANGGDRPQEYRAINPKEKVPALSWHGRVLTENPAIIWFLSERFPEAGILPESDDPVEKAAQLADLCWCASMLHPTVRQVAGPQKWTTGDLAGVKEDGVAKLAKETGRIAPKLGAEWWYGDRWSIIDAYLCWVYTLAGRGDFPIGDYPDLVDYLGRASSWPAYKQAMVREATTGP